MRKKIKRTFIRTILAAMLSAVLLLLTASVVFASEGFTATFAVEGGSATVNVYYTQDYTAADETDAAPMRKRCRCFLRLLFSSFFVSVDNMIINYFFPFSRLAIATLSSFEQFSVSFIPFSHIIQKTFNRFACRP